MQIIQNLNFRILFVLLITTYFLSSCNDDSLVGSELLDQDGIKVNFVDTTTIKSFTISASDSILTNSTTRISQDIFLGEINDDYFGFKKYSTYFQASLGSSPPSFYDYTNESFAQVDSVILLISLSEDLFYGDTSAVHEIQAFQIDQELDEDIELYIFDELNTLADPISDIQTVVPNFEDYTVTFLDDTVETGPSLRIKLKNEFGQKIIEDTTAVKKDSSFLAFFNGIKLVSTTNGKTSLLPLNMRPRALADIGNKMLIYYQDTVAKAYSFPLGGVRHNNVVTENEATIIEDAFDNEILGDSLIFLQGFGTSDARIEIPFANFENYGKILIKKAELEVTVAELPGDDGTLSPIKLLFLFEKDIDGNKTPIEDVLIAQSSNLLTSVFGGDLRTEVDDNDEIIRRYYNMNITRLFQNLIDKDSNEINVIYLGAAVPSLSPERSILYGPGHSKYPMRIKLTYSIPN